MAAKEIPTHLPPQTLLPPRAPGPGPPSESCRRQCPASGIAEPSLVPPALWAHALGGVPVGPQDRTKSPCKKRCEHSPAFLLQGPPAPDGSGSGATRSGSRWLGGSVTAVCPQLKGTVGLHTRARPTETRLPSPPAAGGGSTSPCPVECECPL